MQPLWNPLTTLVESVQAKGGFVNAHAHFDRAYSVTSADFASTEVESTLHEKWVLVDRYKAESSEDSYFFHIRTALDRQREFGVQACLSFVDCDVVAGTRALQAALRAKEYAAKELRMPFVIASQTLKGVLEKTARTHFENALPHIDVIGGLPGADRGHEAEHLDILFRAARQTGKRVHVHVDQLNSAHEKETELLARKTMEHGLEGRVTAVHAISLACHPKSYREEVYRMCKDAGLSFVACPTAWIDARRNETLSPTHNAVTPLDELIPHGLVVALGSDNIADLYKPFSDGNMLTELRVALESTHFYDVKALTDMATVNGLRVMGIDV